ncbi:MAG: slipin family protein [Candidatus Nanohalarchaeota archaeon]|nr:MAG: slipin family protein [Candidatus Nanohaloarchaeota archaeon]
MVEPILIAAVVIIAAGLRVINQYEKGVKFTLGKYSGIMEPGLRFVIPAIQSMERVDTRIKTVDVPRQETMTKDNISVKVNAVIYFKINDAAKSVIEIEDYFYAVSQLAQTSMRNIIGEITLDELLSKRNEISDKIKIIVDKASDPWGIDVKSVELKDVELPEDLKRVMAKQAEAEREKRAVIIKAEGEIIASYNISKAANTLSKAPGALHLRTLQTLNDLSGDNSNTVIFAIPLEILKSFEGYKSKNKK